MPKLGISEHDIVKISKRGDFRIFFDLFWDFELKRVHKICYPRIPVIGLADSSSCSF